MTWHARDSIALVEFIFYIPFALVSSYVCYQHGFKRSSGWIYTLILCIIRIIGGICQFVSHNDPSVSLLQTILLLDSVGLSPLLLATLGLLSRFVDFVNTSSTPKFTTRHFRLLQMVLFVGMILAIVGGKSIDGDATYQIPTTSKIGVILYIVGFVGMTTVFLLSVPSTSAIPSKERRVPLAIALAIPFILVRLIYSMLSVFLHNHVFSIVSGSVPVRIAMSLIEEFVVVALYTLLGLFVDKLDNTTKGPIASRPWNGRQNNRGRETRDRETRDYTAVDIESQQLSAFPKAAQPLFPQANGVAR